MRTTVLVDAENERNVLARVVMLFHRRAIPIHSLVMTSGDGILRMKIETELAGAQSVRVAADLYKLVRVLSVNIDSSSGQSPEAIHVEEEALLAGGAPRKDTPVGEM